MCIFCTLDKHFVLCTTYTNQVIFKETFSFTLSTCILPSPAPIITVKYMSFTLQTNIKCLFVKGNGVS